MSWTDLEPSIVEGGHTGFIDVPLGGIRRAWTGGEVGIMKRVAADLSAFAGVARQVRFRILCDGSVRVQGWFIDDVSTCRYSPILGSRSFTRGNCNVDDRINLSGAVFLLNHPFAGGKTPACKLWCDATADDDLNLTDALFLLNHLFRGGLEPAPPSRCGAILEDSQLGCDGDACAVE